MRGRCFEPAFEAWANGPVIPEVYQHHRGLFQVRTWKRGTVNGVDAQERKVVDRVLKFYGGKTSQWLSNLTHQEEPWIKARKGTVAGQRSQHEITPAAMHEYYSSL